MTKMRPRDLTDSQDPANHKHSKPHHLILKSIAIAPALCTLLNGVCGFASIHLATRSSLGEAKTLPGQEISLAAWLIFLAMLFDMLDGRLARWARKTSDFGAQLDSLCDAISFGVAPAMLMLRTVLTALSGHFDRLSFLPDLTVFERLVWCCAAIYMSCAVIRLARFNVENEPDESAHMSFRGLPSPGAAAVVAAMVLLFVRLAGFQEGWRADPILLAAVAFILPVATLISALLMVSRFKYPHIVNQYIRGKKPLSHLLKIVVIAICGAIDPYLTAAAICLIYGLSGPMGWFLHHRHPSPAATPTPPAPPGNPPPPNHP